MAWKRLAISDCELSDEVARKAKELLSIGLRQMDASHVACAIYIGADYFLTTDKKILNKPITEIAVMNPIDFIRNDFNAD